MLEVAITNDAMDMTKVALIFNGDLVETITLTPAVMDALRQHFVDEAAA
jgi:hypothetical protein